MADLSKLDYQGKYNHPSTGLFKDNTSNDIGADDVRALTTDTGDSFLNRTDDFIDEDSMATNSATKVPSQQSVKAYVDAAALGIVSSWKAPVKVATAVAGTLATSFENGDTVDGIVLATADRILIKNQVTQSENGIYTINASGAPTRSTDANTAAELEGVAVMVQQGTAGANTTWIQTTDGITLGSSNIVWSQVGTTVPDASPTVKGIAKLYTGTGSNTDGSMDQNSITLALPTREFNRTFSEELLFDKNEIEGELYVQDAEITFTVAEMGHLTNAWSIYGQRIQTDGVNPINFTDFNHLSNIASGDVLEAGTYQFIFWHSPDGITRGSVMLPSQETVLLTSLAAPASFAAVADDDNEIDLSWTNNVNAASYEINYSSTGGSGPWIALATPAAGSTSYAHTGLSAGTTYHYRIRCIGDGMAFANSAYSVTAQTTETAGDVVAPTFIFLPADAATDIDVNGIMVITCSEAIRDADGVTEITSANIADYLTVKEDDGAGSDIPFTATIDTGKTIITITPNVVWPSNGDVFIEIDGVEDVNGNESTADSATFTTNDWTLTNGSILEFGDIMNDVIGDDNANLDFGFTVKDMNPALPMPFWRKYAVSGLQSFLFEYLDNGNIRFRWYEPGPVTGFDVREVLWTAPDVSGEAEWLLHYRGAVDTGDGLDRVTLYKNAVEVGSKTLSASYTERWPFNIRQTIAPLRAGPRNGRVKDLFIKSSNGTVDEIIVPVMRSGLDTSGNNRHGTWV